MNKSTSLYLDAVRLAAALVLFIVHAHYLLPGGMPGLWRLSQLGAEAGTVFFVLSGFVIAHVVHTRESRATDYLAARFSRLYSVVLPALLATVVLDLAGAALAPDDYAASMQSGAWGIVASLLFANEIWFIGIRPLSNTPFWSLGYEFWYYMIYAAVCYVPGRDRKCAVVLLIGLVCGPKILLLMPVWLLGVAAYAMAGRVRPNRPAAVLLAIVTAGGLAVLATSGAKAQWHAFTLAALDVPAHMLGASGHVLYRSVFGVLVMLHVIAMATVAPLFDMAWRACERPIRAVSAYTFAIYLFHFPTLKCLVAATAPAGLGKLQAPVVIVAAFAMISVFHVACERLRPALKLRFKAWLGAVAGLRSGSRPTAARGAETAAEAEVHRK